MSQVTNRIAALSPEQRRLLERRLREENIDVSKIKIIPRQQRQAKALLSFAQERLWFIDQVQPGNPYYNISFAIRLSGPLKVAAMGRCFNEIVNRHEILRTSFEALEGKPVQVISPTLTIPLQKIDLRGRSEDEQEVQIKQLIRAEVDCPFDLAHCPLLRTKLLWVSEQEHVLLLTMHHIISDGFSLSVFIREMTALYEAFSNDKPSPLQPLPIQYADFALWQREWLRSDLFGEQLAYWKRQLAGPLPVTRLPLDRPRPSTRSYNGATQGVVLPPQLVEAINALARRENATLFMTFLAAFKTLLYWYGKEEDVIVGVTVANRNRAELEDLIGLFLNTLVMRTDLSGGPTFQELIGRVREVSLGAYANQDLPFDRLLDALRLDRDLSATPLFQVVFAFYIDHIPVLEISGVTVSLMNIDNKVSVFDLIFNVYNSEQGMVLAFTYNVDLFEHATIARMLREFEVLLEAAAARPGAKLGELSEVLERANQQHLSRQDQELEQARRQKLKITRRKTVLGSN